MIARSVSEWGRVAVGEGSFSRAQASALLEVARAHRSGGADGTDILVDHHGHLRARQVVGVVAAGDAVLEILPKVDPETSDEDQPTVRRRLVRMLDVALGLGLSPGATASLGRQTHTLLDVLIRDFAERLLGEVRRGLPRLYRPHEDDLPALRGRLDVVRQFTAHAVRPDRLACRFDVLETDTPLMRVMHTAVCFVARFARGHETQRLLAELRHVFAGIPAPPPARLPWTAVRIDRTNRRWAGLFRMARLFLRRDWQATHHHGGAAEGITLLFPMNDLFERYIAALLRRAVSEDAIEVVSQGGLAWCLGDWSEGEDCRANRYQTRPDLILGHKGARRAIIDTKWKRLAPVASDPKHGVAQADVYQMMAYARLYRCDRLSLLYPSLPGQPVPAPVRFGFGGGQERLSIVRVDVSDETAVMGALRDLAREECGVFAAVATDASNRGVTTLFR